MTSTGGWASARWNGAARPQGGGPAAAVDRQLAAVPIVQPSLPI